VVHYRFSKTATRKGGAGEKITHDVYLVPVIDAGARPDAPIPLWVSCHLKWCRDHQAWLQKLDGDLSGQAVKVLVEDRVSRPISFNRPASKWQEAVRLAGQRGIETHPDAPIVRWPVE